MSAGSGTPMAIPELNGTKYSGHNNLVEKNNLLSWGGHVTFALNISMTQYAFYYIPVFH